jgi:hypothetical protein
MNKFRQSSYSEQVESSGRTASTIQQVPRLEDLPYISSPPIQFTYTSPAVFAAGKYTWNDPASPLNPNRPILANCLYYFRSITFVADIAEQDFIANSVPGSVPKFQMFLRSTGKQILFREPVTMAKYLQNFDYRLVWLTQNDDDVLTASFSGILNQSIGTIGKTPINLSAVISAQEIVDTGYIRMFKEKYPDILCRNEKAGY